MRHTGPHEPFEPLGGREVAPPAGDSDEDSAEPVPIIPVPSNAPPVSFGHPRYDKPSAVWTYRDEAGEILGHVVRWEIPFGKEIMPRTWCRLPDGSHGWRWRALPAPRPLYRLDHLVARPGDPVLIVEGEKVADAAQARFSDHVAVTSPGGAKAARRSRWEPLRGRHVVLWPDADDDGAQYADDVADLVRAAGGGSVRIVRVPPSFPHKWDLAERPPEGVTDKDLRQMVAEAKPAPVHGPLPLFAPMPPSERYPAEALGPILGRAAMAIASKVQVPEAIAAQSVLAAASLVAQAHADVLLPYGQTRPLSLYLVTVAGSGDRKSTADNEALWPVRKRERALRGECDRDWQEWSVVHSAWSAEKRKIESDRKLDFDSRKALLAALGWEPVRPLHPFLTAPDPTVEGLVKAWVHSPAALGIFTAEGGQFVGGHGMSLDHRLKTAATFSEIWDGRPIKRIRAMDGVTMLPGRRLSMHLMVQPDAAAQFLADPLLRDQGFLSRLLVAAPETVVGTRLYRETKPEDEAAIKAYGARLLSIMEAPWPLAAGQQNELEPRVLTMSERAEAAWRAFHDHVETQCAPGEGLVPIRDFAAKAAEHAARIAGVLTVVDDINAGEIDIDAITNALTLADWYVSEALRLYQAARTDPRLLRAQQLLEWMQG